MTLIWVQFAIASLLVLVAGYTIVRFADRFAVQTGLGHVWAGAVLLATATALPELVTGIGAVAAFDSPDLAAGGVFGSNIFNLAILAGLALWPAWRGLMTPRSIENRALGVGAIITGGVAGVFILIAHTGVPPSAVLLLPIALPLIYVAIMFRIFAKPGSAGQLDHPALALHSARSVKRRFPTRAIAGYVAGAAVVLGAGLWLAGTADRLAAEMGWSTSFVGSLLLAASTSLPELAVATAAVRIGAPQLAIADLLGANMITTGVVLSAEALAFGSRPFLAHVSMVHAATAGVAILMTLVLLIRRTPPASPAEVAPGFVPLPRAMVLLCLYIAATAFIFAYG